MLKAEHISFKIGNKFLLKETSITFVPGQFHVIMGANGAGKSTLLKLLAGELKPSSGSVLLNNKALTSYSKNSLATKRAVLSQHYHLSFPITVEEIVLMGRYPYFSTHPTAKDIEICEQAMQKMDVYHLAERDYTTLSGGEAQKVQMSRVLAQVEGEENENKILFLDEPVSHLDVKYQYQLLKVAKQHAAKGFTVIAILHDINLATSFADRILFMKEANVIHELTDVSQLSKKIMQETFDISCTITYVENNKPIVIF